MKKSLIFCSLAIAAAFVSCNEKNDYYTQNVLPTVDVVSGADIAFKAIGGEGIIEVAPTEGQLQATTAQSWCHLTVEGNKIHVSVDENASIESRYAKVEMKAGEASGVTTVQQFGVIVREFNPKDVTVNNLAQDVTFHYDANETLIQATSDADWFTIIAEPDVLRLRVKENPSKEYRDAVISWNIGEVKGQFTLVQFDIADAGLLGSWKFVGMGGANFKTPYEMTATLSENNGTYSLRLIYQTSMDLTFDNVVLDKTRLMLPLGGMIGKRNAFFVYPVIAPGTGAVTYDSAMTEGYFPMELTKDDDGKWHANGDLSGFNGGNFRLEMWRSDDHSGQSASRLVLRDITMDKLD